MTPQPPPTPAVWQCTGFGALLGLPAYGAAALCSWALYGDPEPQRHPISLVVLVALVIAAGVAADSILTYVLARWRDVREADRRSRGGRDG